MPGVPDLAWPEMLCMHIVICATRTPDPSNMELRVELSEPDPSALKSVFELLPDLIERLDRGPTEPSGLRQPFGSTGRP